MRAYLTRSFDRDAKRDGISDEDCREAIRRAERGLIDADLGGGLIKQRIPRGNQGAARGSRAIVFYRRGMVAVFLHIFRLLAISSGLGVDGAQLWIVGGFER